MSSEYIANYIKVGTNDGEINESESEEMLEHIEYLSITLHESKLPMYAERLFIDLKDGEIVWDFKSLKHPSVMQAFQKLVKEKQYDELFTAFLSNQEFEKLNLFYIHELLGPLHDHVNVLYLLNGGIINNDKHSKCARAIRFFVLLGQHGILQHIIDQMMIQKGNVNDLFQTFCNKEQQNGQGMNENDTGAEVERTEDDDAKVETTTTKIKIKKKSTLCFKNTDTDKETVNNDHTRTGYKDSESDSKSDIDIFSEEVIVEQWILLCLGCYSGDVNTVKILLKYVNKAVLHMNSKDQSDIMFRKCNPLAIACDGRYFDIAKNLKRIEANVIPSIHDIYKHSHLLNSCTWVKEIGILLKN